MSKYDFEIDLSMNSSTGLILSKLKPNSTVLEFGCATGRMTRYMKEALRCQVYIVEYDRGAFQKAKEFAQDGICDDIQNYLWLEQFGDVSFDAIIFADVLEHLQNPEEVLEKAASLLKENGCVLVSVPNVTHNDILLRATEEHFDYSETGLLDNTHIHFWGLENIKILGRNAGLTVRTLEGTYCSTGDTEQNVQIGKNYLLENILRERAAGEVYQFVLTMDKQGDETMSCIIEVPRIYSHIYLDTGCDFNVQEKIAVNSVYSGTGTYVLHYEFVAEASACRVRLDPIEGQSAVMHHISICQNGIKRNLIMPNAVEINGKVYLRGDDPMVIAELIPGGGTVSIDAEFVVPGALYLSELENAVWIMQQRIHFLDEKQKAYIQEIEKQNTYIKEKEKQILQTEQQNKLLQADVCGYIALVNQKEKFALGLEQQIETECTRIRDLEAVVDHYQNLKVIRLRSWIGRALRKIKRCIKKVLRRG